MRVSLEWLAEYIDIRELDLPLILEECGFPVESTEDVDGDTVYDIEVTANRPDILSMIGVAKEIKAKTGRNLKLPNIYLFENEKPIKDFKIQIHNYNDTPRYMGCKIENVDVQESPEWLKRRIRSYGLNPKNLLIDLTNYVTVETGQPLHAFSYSLIRGNEINIRRAEKGETIKILSGEEKELDNDILVIADKFKPIAIAGVIGGEESGVKKGSDTFIIESAYFNPILIRKVSKKLNIKTDASFRFERGGCYSMTEFGLLRFLYLLKTSMPDVKIFIPIDIKNSIIKQNIIDLDFDFIRKRLGTDISNEEIISIIKGLDFIVDGNRVIIPDFRRDIRFPVDIVEEIGRIFGYSKIKERIFIPEGCYAKHNNFYNQYRKIRDYLIGLGYYEVATLGLVSKMELDIISSSNKKFIKIANPINRNLEYLTPSPIINLMKVIKNNIVKRNTDLKIFEIGKGFIKEDNRYIENDYLSLLITGNDLDKRWYNQARKVDIFDIKGIMEYILNISGTGEFNIIKDKSNYFDTDQCIAYIINRQKIAVAGKISKDLKDYYKLENDVYCINIDFNRLMNYIKYKSYRKPGVYPSVYRDLALVVDVDLEYNDLLQIITSCNSLPFINVRLFDIYKGKQVPDDKKSMAINLEFNGTTRTLTDKEVEEVIDRILDSVKEKYGAYLREK